MAGPATKARSTGFELPGLAEELAADEHRSEKLKEGNRSPLLICSDPRLICVRLRLILNRRRRLLELDPRGFLQRLVQLLLHAPVLVAVV
jgi:hypothetical protein